MTGMGKGYAFTDTKDVLALKALVVERQALVGMRKTIKQRMDVHRLKEAATGLVRMQLYGDQRGAECGDQAN